MKNVPTPTNNNSNIPPKPIQANKTQDTDFNVQKKPQAKDAAPQSTDKKSLEDMDSNSAQKVKNGSNGNMNGNTFPLKQPNIRVYRPGFLGLRQSGDMS